MAGCGRRVAANGALQSIGIISGVRRQRHLPAAGRSRRDLELRAPVARGGHRRHPLTLFIQ